MHGLDVIKWRMLGICTYAKYIFQDSQEYHLLLSISPYLTMMLSPSGHAETAGNKFVNS